ncbi:protease modulator HflC [Stratiformator vulcanicus]|uniref:Protein HflC n=1 Tax=Stratiformator vulcanicus TaxID=2527980 RepID=A0A517R350_9PLAN|nr:protease modulator HflC [Stratiformator vulcanicus]QDT38309.1 Modulator of FtsH protease HflC [Stratiformator vulcanicus]
MKNFTPIALMGGLILVVLAIVIANASIYTVNERELAVILQFGRPVASRTEPGLYFKTPFVQEVRRLPKTLQYWRSSEREKLEDLPTSDGKKIEVSAYAIWRITDPEQFVKVLRDVDNAETAIKLRVRSAIRDVITAHSLAEVVRSSDRDLSYSLQVLLPGTSNDDAVPEELPPVDSLPTQPGADVDIEVGRERIVELVSQNVTERLRGAGEPEPVDRGIELVDVGVNNIEFVPQVREAAFERLRTFMETIAAGYLADGEQRKQEIINEARAEVERIIGEGERDSKRIRGDVEASIIADFATAISETGEFYNFLKTLEVYEKSFNSKTRMIMTTDSDLMRLLKSPQGRKND